MNHYQKLERMYLNAKFNINLYPSTTIKISDRQAVITLEVSDQYFHALGAIHGSVYFKLLDDASFFAVNSIVEDAFVLTTNFNTNIVRPVNKGRIKSVGTVVFESKRLFIGESKMYDREDNLIAFGTGHFMKSRMALTEDIGYK